MRMPHPHLAKSFEGSVPPFAGFKGEARRATTCFYRSFALFWGEETTWYDYLFLFVFLRGGGGIKERHAWKCPQAEYWPSQVSGPRQDGAHVGIEVVQGVDDAGMLDGP